jgi:hypothetical protein
LFREVKIGAIDSPNFKVGLGVVSQGRTVQ